MRVQSPAGGAAAQPTVEADLTTVVEAPRRSLPELPQAAAERAGRRRPRRFPRPAILACDVLCLAIALAIAGDDRDSWQTAAALAVWAIAFVAFALDAPGRLQATLEARRTLAAVAVGGCGLALTAATTPATVAAILACALALELAWRGAFRIGRERRLAAGRASRRAVLVCPPGEAASLTGHLDGRFAVVGRVDPPTAADEPNIPAEVEALVVAERSLTRDTAVALIRLGRRRRLDVCFVSDLPGMFDGGYAVSSVHDRMIATVHPPAAERAGRLVKRAADVAAAGILLVALAPLLAGIALAVRWTSGGPAFYRQLRVTTNGRVFWMVKFRTMTDAPDAPGQFPPEDAGNGVPDAVEARRAFYKMPADDPRITRLGRHLRRYSLDELPQLWNILRGDMSLIGPRPLQVEQVEANRALLEPRLAVPGGLSGWWQVNGRSDTQPEDAVDMDMYYIDNWSLSLDLYILVRTFGAVLFGRGAV